MSLSIDGKIVNILEIEKGVSKAGKEWRKQSFVLDTGAHYNPQVCFSVFGDDKLNMLDGFANGQEVKVAFNVSSREYNGKWYHNLDAWKIEALNGSSAAAPSSAPAKNDAPPISDMNPADDSEEDDLPF